MWPPSLLVNGMIELEHFLVLLEIISSAPFELAFQSLFDTPHAGECGYDFVTQGDCDFTFIFVDLYEETHSCVRSVEKFWVVVEGSC